ncbi:hypothetical protein [Hymenobacter profundi]|uniref:LysR substrate-binding domain-containing protein n=1 Tax=Hymenobacter profundi TaxID=1982110 RepID=A0ABS6WWI0_9BACT|nr:hypothetical protein [Hymenobacter profundi]MBW3127823.1 hypothetical protein [Hymenobacter profundi]
MNPELMFADVVVVPPHPALRFAIGCSPSIPTYPELVLEDGTGVVASWVVSQPLQQVAKHPVLLWRLATEDSTPSLRSLETGSVQVVLATAGTSASLRTQLARGMLHLTFGGWRAPFWGRPTDRKHWYSLKKIRVFPVPNPCF